MIQEENFQTERVYRLENDYLIAWISPAAGANLFRVQVKSTNEELFHSPASPIDLHQRPVHFGSPLLIPPNRIRNGTFSYKGKKFDLPINTPEGHHIHGLSLNRPWRFLTLNDSSDVSEITFSFDVVDYPDLFTIFPVKLKFEYTVRLIDASVEAELRIENLDSFPMPIGAGFHTWFLLGGGAKRWHLQLPFEKVWELDEESFPTGNLVKGDQVDLLRAGINLEGKNFDTVFFRGNNPAEATLIRDDGFSITYTLSEEFKHWVLHTPLDRGDCIAIEPYSWVTDAPNLKLNSATTGLIELASKGEQFFQTRIQIG